MIPRKISAVSILMWFLWLHVEYLSRLVDVEQMRGASGGDTFKALLVRDETTIPEGMDDKQLDLQIGIRVSVYVPDESDIDFSDEPEQEETEMDTETTVTETDAKIYDVDWWTDHLSKVSEFSVS